METLSSPLGYGESIVKFYSKMRMVFRFSLKQLLLVCVCLALVVAWLGIQNQFQHIGYSGETKWHSFAPSGGYPGDGIGGVHIVAMASHLMRTSVIQPISKGLPRSLTLASI
ncbi:hypothetical protein Pla52n_65260 [Stieleria varia]|uniref:Uncharacterized protein n=1 Tax=Stieleria varia TaxID=2528005 RepID=A0A5C5ZWP2_9BACT|nr:hypothetical protein Pla52n_65260 [Stieleria varia]